MVKESEGTKNTDFSTDMAGGLVQHLTFNPSKNFAEENVVLFGITVRQQGRRLIIITKIYEDERREEIVNKLGVMVKVMMDLVPKVQDIIDSAHLVDQKDILAQISKRKISANKLIENIEQEQDIIVETIDLITGEMVPVEFSMKLVKIEKEMEEHG